MADIFLNREREELKLSKQLKVECMHKNMYSNFLVQNLLQNSRIQGYTFLSKLQVVLHARWQHFQQEDQMHPSPWDELPLKELQ